VLIDSGPLIALFDKDDHYHERVKAFLKGKPYRFLTTLAVLTEVTCMLDFSVNAQIDFLRWVILRGLSFVEMDQADIARIITLTEKYSDLPMDFSDATLVVAAEKTGVHSIISIDSDFDIYRLPGKRLIKNLFQ
jgi:predicted nucleic acid-binding protein